MNISSWRRLWFLEHESVITKAHAALKDDGRLFSVLFARILKLIGRLF